jgi:hypothetical protein
MAASGGNAGKIVAGCSCLTMVVCLAVIVFINVGWTMLATQAPELAQYGSIVMGPVAWVDYCCCSLSGLGMIVGIVMLLTGKKSSEES